MAFIFSFAFIKSLMKEVFTPFLEIQLIWVV
jgi:hypothetical protein